MPGSGSLYDMMFGLGGAAIGILVTVGGFAMGITPLGIALFLLGLCVLIACGLVAICEAVQYGFAQGMAGHELPQLTKLPASRAEEPSSAS